MRFNTYEFMIACRFLMSGRSQTILIILGIAVGVAVQVFLISLMDGLQRNLIQRTIGSSPHITIAPPLSSPQPQGIGSGTIDDCQMPLKIEEGEILSWQRYNEYLEGTPGITVAAPMVNGNGYIEKGRSSFPVIIKGVTLPEADVIYKFKGNLVNGDIRPGGNNVLIGTASSEKSGLQVGDTFYLRNQKGTGDHFMIQGIFDLGSSAANNMVVMSLERAQAFLDVVGISAIEIQVQDVFAADNLAERLRGAFNRIKVESWQERNKELLSGLRSQDTSSAMIQFFVLLSITLGIASVLAIIAIQKSRQLGILKAMGTNDKGAARIFIIQGFSMGFAGALVGILLGLGLAELFMIGTKSSGGPTYELKITLTNILLPALLATAAASVAALVPARRAAGLNPMEVIRNE
ncbi:MAG: ABC transporter permease [Peptococcaceae bacterium]|nr:ABC transporter permease [Peptococcaceae bacterium]